MIISDWSSDVFSSDLEVTDRVIEGYDYLKPPRIDAFIVRLSPDGRELSKTWLIGAMAASTWGKRQIGRASCRERVSQYATLSGLAVQFTKNKILTSISHNGTSLTHHNINLYYI